jgi:hypothetical protein
MNATPTAVPKLVDISDLPPSVAQAVIDHVNALRELYTVPAKPGRKTWRDMTTEEWIASHRAWVASLPQNPNRTLDDSRASFYE